MSRYHESLSHWADQNAQKIVGSRSKSDGSSKSGSGSGKSRFVCASGITPSGTVHIGNFREIISVDLVHRALLDRGVGSRFIYSWDDYDTFRKVPANIPDGGGLEQYLRQPIVDVPDPLGREASYARAHEAEVEAVLPLLGIEPEYIYQTKKYRTAVYAEGMRAALEKRSEIRAILNEHRKKPLAEDWWPVSVFSRFTGKDNTQVLDWDGEWGLRYRCRETGREDVVDLRRPSDGSDGRRAGVKLFWRIDWPMRWAFEQVDFEPAGKEHHSAGGSFDTAKRISREVYNFEAPVTFKYDFISIKGMGGKISSSLGNVIGIGEALEVYQPEVLRYLFAGTRPNAEFSISFDLDVIKIYEDYDRCERIYYGLEDVNEKRRAREGRIYELSQVSRAAVAGAEEYSRGGQPPIQLPFRHLCNLLLIYNGDIDAALEAFPAVADQRQRETARCRARCAWHWLGNHAPDDFRFALRTGKEEPLSLAGCEKAALSALYKCVEDGGLEGSDKEVQDCIYAIARDQGLEPRDFFVITYRALIGKDAGPRLAGFLKVLGQERALTILHPNIR